MNKLSSLKQLLCFITAMSLGASMCGCSQKQNSDTPDDPTPVVTENVTDTNDSEPASQAKLSSTRKSYSELFSVRDKNQEGESVTTEIRLGSEITVEGNGAEVSDDQITITAEGVYRVTGQLSDGQIIVNAPKAKVQLLLDNAEISCSYSSAIYGESSDKLFITTAENSVNTLTNGDPASSEIQLPCIFSSDSITLNGCGSLNINAKSSDGIQSKDDIVITGGDVSIDAFGDGIKGRDYVAACGGNVTVKCGEDGIKSTNIEDTAFGFVYIEGGSFAITSGNDGIQAETDIVTTGGEFTITTGGGADNSTKAHMDDFGSGHGGFGDMDGSGFGHGGFGHGNIPEDFDFDAMTPPDDFDPDHMTPPDGFDPDQTPPDVPSGRNEKTPENSGQSSDNSAVSDSMKGLKGCASIEINGGTFAIDSADDSIHSNGDVLISGGRITLNSGDDGIHADSTVKLGGSADISITKSYEGIEGAVIEISGGKIDLTSEDDGINGSDGSYQGGMGTMAGGVHVSISGGELHVNAQGDGLDSNGDMTISGGTVIVDGPTNGGNGALDGNGKILVNGGTLIAVGSSQMAECPDEDSEQMSVAYGFDSTQTAGTAIALCDEKGNQIASHSTAKTFDHVVISSPDIAKGKKYSITADGKEIESFTADSTVTLLGNQSMAFGFGGHGGGKGDFNKGDFQMPTDENGDPVLPEGGRFPGGKGDKFRGDQSAS